MGLSRCAHVWSAMGQPAVARRVVTVAGTNGKGSTIAMLEAALLESGLRVGVYTSPHITRYNERIRLNGLEASDDVLVEGFECVERARAAVPLTYFEFGTLAAFSVFSGQELDIVLLEVGLGGRLDAVNIVDPDLAIISSIALDHEDWLGSDLEQIGREKAGIMRQEIPVVLGQDMPVSVMEYAGRLSCSVRSYGEDFGLENGQVFLGQQKGLDLPSCPFPVSNLLVAAQTITLMAGWFDMLHRLSGSTQSLLNLLARTRLAGRCEWVAENVLVDVAHNPHAAAHLSEVLAKMSKGERQVFAVYSALNDKDVAGVVNAMSSLVDRWYIAPLDCPRAMTLAKLESAVGNAARDVLSFAEFENAIRSVVVDKGKDTIVVIFGSFFAVESAKAFFSSNE